MDTDKRSAQVKRLEVVESVQRRCWSEDEKLKIVLESLHAPRQVAATARRGISRSLLLRWRRSFRPEPKDAPAQTTGLRTGDDDTGIGDDAWSSQVGRRCDRVAAGARMRITGALDAATLTAAVAALADGRPR
jgi:transposase